MISETKDKKLEYKAVNMLNSGDLHPFKHMAISILKTEAVGKETGSKRLIYCIIIEKKS